jgi:hypothetical protein
MQLAEISRTMTAMTDDPLNRSCLYLTDREARSISRPRINPCALSFRQEAGLSRLTLLQLAQPGLHTSSCV